MHGRLCAMIALLLLVIGCTKTLPIDPQKPVPTPVPLPSPSVNSLPPWPFPSADMPKRLYQRALAYDQATQKVHLPNGLIVDIRYTDNTRQTVAAHQGHGDQAFNTGSYLAAEAFRYSVTGDATSADNLKRLLQAVHRLIHISDVPGLLCRGLWKSGDPGTTNSGDHVYAGDGDNAGYYYMTDPSGDQYTSIFFGLGVAYDSVQDPQLKVLIRQDVADMANFLWNNGLKMIDKDGQVSQFGDLNAPPFQGFNAMIDLNFFQLAAHITGDSHFQDDYNELANHRFYAQYVGALISGIADVTSYFNYNMAGMNLYHLLRLNNDSNGSMYQMGFDYGWWRWISGDKQSFFNFIYASARGGDDKDQAIADGIDTLVYYPEQLPVNFPKVDLSTQAWLVDYQDPFWGVRQALGRSPVAKFPLPPGFGPPTDYRWQRDPRETVGGNDSDYTEYPGSDYMLAYWMGRHYGYIPAP